MYTSNNLIKYNNQYYKYNERNDEWEFFLTKRKMPGIKEIKLDYRVIFKNINKFYDFKTKNYFDFKKKSYILWRDNIKYLTDNEYFAKKEIVSKFLNNILDKNNSIKFIKLLKTIIFKKEDFKIIICDIVIQNLIKTIFENNFNEKFIIEKQIKNKKRYEICFKTFFEYNDLFTIGYFNNLIQLNMYKKNNKRLLLFNTNSSFSKKIINMNFLPYIISNKIDTININDLDLRSVIYGRFLRKHKKDVY
jgi:hypothetical protein